MAMMHLSSYTLFSLIILMAINRKWLQGLVFMKNKFEPGAYLPVNHQKCLIQRSLEGDLKPPFLKRKKNKTHGFLASDRMGISSLVLLSV